MPIVSEDGAAEAVVMRHTSALERAAVRHNLILGLLARGLKPGSTRFWSFDTPGSCAFQMGERNIVLGEIARADGAALAGLAADLPFEGIVGPDQTADWLAEACAARGLRFGPRVAQLIHGLEGSPRHPGAPGAARPATADDLPVLAQFMHAFFREALPHDPVPDDERLAEVAGSGRCLLWIVDDRPVSMAGDVRGTPTIGAIGGVYTPPAERGRGYAGAVTAALADRMRAQGKRHICLYTDASNPFSNRCYARIGFRPVCTSLHIVRARP